MQVKQLQIVRQQLYCSGLSPEDESVPSGRTGPERQRQPAGFGSEAALWFSAESTEQTEDSEVRLCLHQRDKSIYLIISIVEMLSI